MLKHTNMVCSIQFKYCIITPDSLAGRCHQDPGGFPFQVAANRTSFRYIRQKSCWKCCASESILFPESRAGCHFYDAMFNTGEFAGAPNGARLLMANHANLRSSYIPGKKTTWLKNYRNLSVYDTLWIIFWETNHAALTTRLTFLSTWVHPEQCQDAPMVIDEDHGKSTWVLHPTVA